jgi:hypothetical protein
MRRTQEQNVAYAPGRKVMQATEVRPCSRCGCPVLVAEGATELHLERCHSGMRAAPPVPGVKVWEREW